jgi:GH15 family glucan-1,4-alpha-glucosidase
MPMNTAIHKYGMGVIGNCSYLAYIDTLARIQWLCMPRFDSSFIFGALLDQQKGGEFSISTPDEPSTTKQYYQNNTNILCTEFHAGSGAFKVTDFAPRFFHFERYFKPLMLIRKLEPLSGDPVVKVVCTPRGDWGDREPQVVFGSNHIRFLDLGPQIRLTTGIPLNYVFEQRPFVLNEVHYLVFTYGEPLEAPLASTAEDFLRRTKDYWVQWVKTTSIPTLYQEEVIRSALVLKLHQYEDTGGIIASGTTSLPEDDGAGRNWDYRYCWIRDSYYTLKAFHSIGHFEELEKYFHFIQNVVLNETDVIQPVYGVGGEKHLPEQELPLSGYRNNQPVRKGNNAYLQSQNDVYGQLLACLLPLYTDRRLDNDRHRRQFRLVGWLLELIEKTMDVPDSGIWEFRGRRQFHCYTYLFHWVGCKAASRIARALSDEALAAQAEQLCGKAARKIEQCFSEGKRAYVQAIGVENLDASTLQLINLRYLEPTGDGARAQLAALEKELLTPNGLLLRYAHRDDFGLPKVYFLACSFWYAEALACVGRIDDACKTLEQAKQCSNHLGLFSEDADSSCGQWGNFPQTYSHVGFMNAVYRIANKKELPIFLD